MLSDVDRFGHRQIAYDNNPTPVCGGFYFLLGAENDLEGVSMSPTVDVDE